MKKKWFHNKTRIIIQFAVLALILGTLIVAAFNQNLNPDYEKYCPFGGIMSFGSKLNIGSMSCAISETQVFIGLGIALMIVLVGKLFCGWLCPVGTISEWLNKLGSRLGVSITLKGVLDRILRLGKYVLLFFAAYFTMYSSELWCKKFCPYFGAVTGFDVDTVLLFSLLAIAVVVIGSIFIKKLWCKYFCFLGALSNVFSNFILTGPIILVYVILLLAGVKIGLIWLLLAVIAATAATEIFRFKFFSISAFKIRRGSSCTGCSICDAHCPEGIEVSSYETVDHPDCTLCLDCVKSCTSKESLKVRGGKWMPPAVLVLVIALALILAKQFPIATLSERWGNYEQVDSLNTVGKVVFEELKTVKCFGSAKSMQNRVARIPGVIGMDAWASKNKVMLYYDASRLSETDVKRAVFTPSRYNIRPGIPPSEAPAELVAYRVGIWELWDGVDNAHVYRMLMQNKAVYGFATEFGEPVYVTFYIDPAAITPEQLREIIEQDSYEYVSNGEKVREKVDFEYEGEGSFVDTLSYLQFQKDFFPAYDRAFNGFRKFTAAQMQIFEIDFPDAENSNIQRRMSYLTSHVSFEPGTVRLRTEFTDRPILQIWFVSDSTNAGNIMTHIAKDNLTCMRSDGSTFETENIFKFEGDYRVKSLKP
ncbi:MAG: 4Fe-4S binding protein [Candidatus Neomarinimicrobiota bacterium]|jgi:ferredoxin|nr:4Fe-4S binding protein [Candidatus Neomarinimicrobiota bacterium]MDX9779965.1 4Fe-4S binding protein [bacterium]